MKKKHQDTQKERERVQRQPPNTSLDDTRGQRHESANFLQDTHVEELEYNDDDAAVIAASHNTPPIKKKR